MTIALIKDCKKSKAIANLACEMREKVRVSNAKYAQLLKYQ